MKKALSIFAVCLAAIMILSLAACKKQADTAPTGATEATKATEVAAAATTAATTAADSQQTVDAAQSGQNDTAQSEIATAGADGYIDEGVAIENVRKQVGNGAEILSYYKGYTPDGIEAWVVVVAPVTNSSGPERVVYYSGYLFCYADTSSNEAVENVADPLGYSDQEVAIENVRKQVGSGAEIISCEQGYTPDGLAAWVIVVAPVTNGSSAETVTYYAGSQFCYPASE